jgi:hypothetical protein
VFDSWIFGQHVYWSIGRGLAEARSQDKTILRLKVVLEEGGWTMARGATAAASSAPGATPDLEARRFGRCDSIQPTGIGLGR